MPCFRSHRHTAALAGVFLVAACGSEPHSQPAPVTRLTPQQMLLCTEGVLAQRAIRADVAPLQVDRAAWRLRLRVLTQHPTGWLDKGDLIHDGARVSYLPHGATEGLHDDRILNAIAEIDTRCI